MKKSRNDGIFSIIQAVHSNGSFLLHHYQTVLLPLLLPIVGNG